MFEAKHAVLETAEKVENVLAELQYEAEIVDEDREDRRGVSGTVERLGKALDTWRATARRIARAQL